MSIPLTGQRLVVGDQIDPTWRRFLASLSTQDELNAAVSAIATALGSPDGTVASIPAQTDETISLIQGLGISITGTDADGYTIALRQLNNSGVGAELVKTTRDAYGRIEGTEAAILDDLSDVDAATPAEGDILYRNGTDEWVPLSVGDDGQVLTLDAGLPIWDDLPAGGGGSWTTFPKLSDQSVTNNATLFSDADMQFALAASSLYAIRGKVFFDTSATPDFKFGLNYSGTATSARTHFRAMPAGTPAGTDNENTGTFSTLSASLSVTSAGSGIGFVELDIIIVTDTAGTFSFQWAQNTSNGSATTVYGGSYLERSNPIV